jgi:flavin-dependent dehydrogenase
MVGTTPAAGRVLLVGDAAGLVNPLQGEGISQAMTSGRLAAESILAEPRAAAQLYRVALGSAHLPYHRIAVAAQGWLVSRPWAIAGVARILMTVGRLDAVSGGWSVFWNELLDGAPANRHQRVAAGITRTGKFMTARSATAAWFDSMLGEIDPSPSWPAGRPSPETVTGA